MSLKRELDVDSVDEEVARNTAENKKSKFNLTPKIAADTIFDIGQCIAQLFALSDTSFSGSKRKVQASEFKGKLYVNIREYYVDKATQKEMPGNKGIALTVEQWNSLKEQVSWW